MTRQQKKAPAGLVIAAVVLLAVLIAVLLIKRNNLPPSRRRKRPPRSRQLHHRGPRLHLSPTATAPPRSPSPQDEEGSWIWSDDPGSPR